jgi:hypothetical protein
MVEVFKTNVTSNQQAQHLVDLLEDYFAGYKVNFDLEDCDRILRVEAPSDPVEPQSLISLLKDMGVRAEVLAS